MAEHTPTARPSPGPNPGNPEYAAIAYAELARIILDGQSLSAVLCRVAEIAKEMIPGATEVSITLVERDRPRTVGFTGSIAPALDERQYTSGRGPCVDAATTGQTIYIDDTAVDTHYPEFSRQAHRSGIRQSLSVGLPTLQVTTGSVNVYGSRVGGSFTDQTHDVASRFASYAAIALANAALYAGAVQEVAQLKEAMISRARIEQAKGMIMRDENCTPDQAFDILRRTSSRTNRKLRDVAHSIVSAAGLPQPR